MEEALYELLVDGIAHSTISNALVQAGVIGSRARVFGW
jgi:hypothetical protein